VNKDRIGRCGAVLAGVIVCSLVFSVVGCEPQSRTINFRARDLSVAMVGDEYDPIVRTAQAQSDTYITEEDDGLDAEALAAAREYMGEEEGDTEQISRIQAMKMAMLPIHGGAPKAYVPPAPAPKFRGGGGNKNNNRKKSNKKKKGGRRR
jgi:hypothetical protein